MLLKLKYLASIKSEVASGTLPVSDAILLVLILCRGSQTEEHLTLLNRELLGYLQEEIAVAEKADAEPKISAHRWLAGFWVSLAAAKGVTFAGSNSTRARIFYNDGMSELEALLDRVSISDLSWVSIAFDASRNAAFMCSTSSLQVVYDGARKYLCDVIDALMEQCAGAPLPRQLTNASLLPSIRTISE
jgi:hypothetical protein